MLRTPLCQSAIPMLCTALVACAVLAGGSAAHAQPRTYALDPVHTRVMFAVDHAGFSRAIGTVSGSTGTLRFDPDDWTTARLEAWVPLQRVDLGDERWNQATLAANLLDAHRYPYAVFVSDRIEPVEADRARVHGSLTMRGATMPVVLDVTLNALKRHPMPPFRRTVGFSATATLQRSDFGISAWSSMIGGEVELRIEAEAAYAPRARFTDEGGTMPDGPPLPLPDGTDPDGIDSDAPDALPEAHGTRDAEPDQARSSTPVHDRPEQPEPEPMP